MKSLGKASTAASSESIMSFRSLRKVFGHGARARVALDDLTFSVPKGSLFGLVGPNGAGKSTAIRILLGLTRATAGSCDILGTANGARLRDVSGRVGVVMEETNFFPTWSGRENLVHLLTLRGYNTGPINECLASVELSNASEVAVSKYSLGMKQRLGLAAALVKDPDVLILDEPSNGLDPVGRVEFRSILRGLVSQGKTIFLCSHLLSEVEELCDWFAILAHGRCLMSGEMVKMLSSVESAVVLAIRNQPRAVSVLRRSGYDAASDGSNIRVKAPLDQSEAIVRSLADAKMYPLEVRRELGGLEDLFLELTSRGAESVLDSEGPA